MKPNHISSDAPWPNLKRPDNYNNQKAVLTRSVCLGRCLLGLLDELSSGGLLGLLLGKRGGVGLLLGDALGAGDHN